MKSNYSTTGRGQRSPPKVRESPPDPAPSRPSGPSAVGVLNNFGGAVHSSDNNSSKGITGSPSLLAPSEGGGAGGAGPEGVGVLSKRGSGLRDLLGTETNVERDRERSRVQAEALKKQVEDNKVCGDGWMGGSHVLDKQE